jgi:hypothetical protein
MILNSSLCREHSWAKRKKFLYTNFSSLEIKLVFREENIERNVETKGFFSLCDIPENLNEM